VWGTDPARFSLARVPAGRTLELAQTAEYSYVKDFEVSDGIASPAVGTVEEGFVVSVEPALEEEGAIRLGLTVGLSRLGRPVSTFTTNLNVDEGGGPQVTIELPEIEAWRSRVELRLADGGTVLLLVPTPLAGGRKGEEKRGTIALFLEARCGAESRPR
jgi:hypothetical protein